MRDGEIISWVVNALGSTWFPCRTFLSIGSMAPEGLGTCVCGSFSGFPFPAVGRLPSSLSTPCPLSPGLGPPCVGFPFQLSLGKEPNGGGLRDRVDYSQHHAAWPCSLSQLVANDSLATKLHTKRLFFQRLPKHDMTLSSCLMPWSGFGCQDRQHEVEPRAWGKH